MRARTIAMLSACALLGAASAEAQMSEAWHFGSDSSRHARVDDRGGLGQGYSFSIEYDPSDGNSEDFCAHCRLTVLVSDPGLDLAELERVGIQRSDLLSAAGMLSALQSVAAQDPTGLATSLEPGISGTDLDALVAEITRIQGEIALVITALETLATLQDASFDWSSASIGDVVAALSLRMDTAFRGDFSDPNDPRIHNSGVAVYGVPQLLSGLAGQGVPMSVQTEIESALSSIPGLSGALEISGDDDDVLAPASFHGYRTDLTIRQRTYTVNGNSAYLIVYTIVNDTSRVFPLVEASMMADFDIPPTSYDTSTDFDPATQMVMVYDPVPYTMPEQHYWFGLAPARAAGAPVPGEFAFANWNIDRNLSLAQWGSTTTQNNRFRFFLFDPSVSGDHDDATGRSEKQGAVSMLLAGPLLPGDARSVAFCYAAGEGGSSAAARAELTAIMNGCRAIYTAVTPMCGDGILQYPEECDDATSATCNAACQRVSCGDGRVDAPEECDDANTAAGDGCNGCLVERCGNARLDFGEACDDGNASNADGCLSDCTSARCGDGFVRSGCAPGTDCGCAGYEHCLTGRFTIDMADAGSRFAPLVGTPIDYRIGFDVLRVDTTTLSSERGIRVLTGPLHVEMVGAPLATELATALEGGSWTIDVRAAPFRGSYAFITSRVRGFAGGMEYGFELYSSRVGLTYTTDAFGRPVLSTVRYASATARLTSTTPGGPATDTATGAARGVFGSVPAGSGGELCDDGNASDFDACTNACVPAACGDGIVQASVGEECDGGATPPSWCVGCLRTGDSCGDGVVDASFGELCDDGNTASDDGCSASCRPESCGDGVVQASEECDDGANGDGDGCTDACVLERCGDGVVQPSEACDTGALVSDTAACTASCEDAACGDGLVHEGVEGCDDGNLVDLDGCSASCVLERCGDGRPGPSEECDDGNTDERDGCSPDCRFEICGDARPGPGEQCDDGNLVNGDGCDKDCLLENLEACGDGAITTGEQCDDGARENGDGCDEFCQLDDPGACGNGTLDAGEGCDDGNTRSGDGCSRFCMVERCGDGVQVRGEACDDGNDRDGDGCSSCALEPSECGNGLHEHGEQCDGGAGCDAECRATEPAPLFETCGNGALEYGEQCDDGGREDGNGCDALCQLEASVCGNARVERGETCDEGDALDGDGCSASCLIEGEEPPAPMPPAGCGCSVPSGAPGAPLALLALALAVVIRRRR